MQCDKSHLVNIMNDVNSVIKKKSVTFHIYKAHGQLVVEVYVRRAFVCKGM